MNDELVEISRKYEDAEVLSKEYKQQISKLEVALEAAKKLSSDKRKADETQSIPSSALESKGSQEDNTITQDDDIIKLLQEKIIELESRTSDDYAEHITSKHEVEIKELNQKISELEKMNEEKSKSLENLEGLIKGDGIEIKESNQKLEKLQEEKDELGKEIENLKIKLKEKTEQYEQLKMSVQKEKEDIEVILAEERKAKKNVEAAYASLENQIEELQGAKKSKFLSKFMCF